jgi:hypothetical protein
LASADPLGEPRRSPNFFGDQYAMDLQNIIACVHTVRGLTATPPLSSATYAIPTIHVTNGVDTRILTDCVLWFYACAVCRS